MLSFAGLPEEVNVSKAVLKRDFIVAAFSSLDRELHKCWDVSYGSDLDSSRDLATVSFGRATEAAS